MSETPSAGKPPVLPAASADITAPLVGMLRQEMPHVFTDGRVDFEKLKATLGASTEEGKERYGLTWAGKAEAFRNVQSVSTGTLAPMPSESVDWDTTGNAIIEGDNLEVLKLLQRPYHGKVKMIYIDPPYNTGNEFIYPDNFREGLADYLRYSGQVSEEGFAQSTNKDTSGRYHSNWLSMMYPRLFLARNLLREDGVIFVSIDDHEVHNLRHLMDEVFGEENFVAQIVWEGAGKNDARQIGVSHEYVVVFARNRSGLPREWLVAKEGVEPVLREVARLRASHGTDFDEISRALAAWYRANKATPSFANRRFRYVDQTGAYKEDDPTAPGGRKFELKHPTTGNVIPLRRNRGWSFSQEEFERLVEEKRISFITDTSIMVRRYLHETDRLTPQSVIYQPARSASERLDNLLGASVFDFPKDEAVLSQFAEMATGEGENIILDFFAGSGTTAQAVLELNAKDGGNRKFILVQLPEKTDKHEFPTIAHITRERVRRVIAKLADAEKATAEAPKQGTIPLSSSHTPVEAAASKPDLGFRAFRLSASNFHVWDTAAASDGAALAKQIELSADNVRPDAAREDLLYELILRAGLPPSAIVEKISLPDAGGQAAKEAYDVNCGDLLVCVETAMTAALMRALVARKPKRLVCLDKAFAGDDAAKTNALLEAQSHDVLFYTA
ncbi:MAG: site-specific DNA-methyltransferase [Rhodocyclaceae bacterium]|jgi:adenine-specific DNA-methyltransferase|nr:site-specific DNA-methyltransferase [Rhodocyclaceae bacterium]MCA3025831.1 site-specific DNA-methyltransferase [Rhodocyclaceae bacterium]MCA3032626.1 site-specific DNA-methyltransferase [Rhodocyclaceae bacterium]MCA3036370.1 site-specific DNA-methyltransferase [Rhodocyclaceae bacterium]MCA3040203.1 site-specific DNA-methyltransferase [Rhodocyclaceae bacterium]